MFKLNTSLTPGNNFCIYNGHVFDSCIDTVVKEIRRKMFRQDPIKSAQQMTTKNEYYDHISLLYFETRRCRYQSIIFVCFYLYVAVVNFMNYSDMDKMMDINDDKC